MPVERPYPDIPGDGFTFHPHPDVPRDAAGGSDWELIAMCDNGANRHADGSVFFPGRMSSGAQDSDDND